MGIFFKCGTGRYCLKIHTTYGNWCSIKLLLARSNYRKHYITNIRQYDDDLSLQHYLTLQEYSHFFTTCEHPQEYKGIIYLLGQTNIYGYYTYSQCEEILNMIHENENIHTSFREEMFMTQFIEMIEYSIRHHQNVYIM